MVKGDWYANEAAWVEHFSEPADLDPGGERIDIDQLPDLVESFRRGTILGRLEELSEQLGELSERLSRISPTQSVIATIQYLSDATVNLRQPVMVVVTDLGDSFLCQFTDCNISASGETQFLAVENLKDIMVATYKRLSAKPANRLGLMPAHQLAVLSKFLVEPK